MKYIIILLLSLPTFGQITISNQIGNDVRNKLIECQYTEGELELIKQMLQQSGVQQDLQDRIINSLSQENKSLRNAVSNYTDIMNVMYQKEAELIKIIQKESRKRKANKWLYFALGAGAMFGASQI